MSVITADNIAFTGVTIGTGIRNVIVAGSNTNGESNVIIGGTCLGASRCILGTGGTSSGSDCIAGFGLTINLGSSVRTIALGGDTILHSGSDNAFSFCGVSNTIAGGDNSGIIGSSNCTLSSAGARNVIINSSNTTTISSSGSNNTFIGTDNSDMTNAVDGNTVIGGSTHLITGGAGTDDNIIAAGTGHTINSSSSGIIRTCAILGGSSASITNSTTFTMQQCGILGGDVHTIGNRVVRSCIIGGFDNDVSTSGTAQMFNSAVIGGSTNNIQSSSSVDSGRNIILGGTANTISATLTGSVLSAGLLASVSSTISNSTAGTHTGNAIIGATSATISNRTTYSVILGGTGNQITTSSTGGGNYNTITGGYANVITSSSNVAAGLSGNSIIAGNNNTISATGSSSCLDSAIVYGLANTLENNNTCLLGGRLASISPGLSGSVCFTDNEGTAFNCGSANRFVTKFVNGYYLATNATGTTGLQLGPGANTGSGSWTAISDIRTKNIHNEINYTDVLNELDNVKVYNYNFKNDPEGAVKKIGCIAQEFHGAFADKLGIIPTEYTIHDDHNKKFGAPEDDPIQVINEGSVRYVIMSCVKALKSKVEHLNETVSTLTADNMALQDRVATLESQIGMLLAQFKNVAKN